MVYFSLRTIPVYSDQGIKFKYRLLLNGDVHPLGSADVKLTHDTKIHKTCLYNRSVWRAQSKIVESAYIGLLFINHGGLSQ